MSRPGIVLPAPIALPEHELLARMFRALGDATRLRILETLLQCGTASQKELMTKLGATQSRMSQHMSCLVWCGFVTVQRDGRRAQYSVDGVHAQQLIGLSRAFLADNANAVGGCTPVLDDHRGHRVQVYGVL